MATKRIELKSCSVVFNPEDHTYYLPLKNGFNTVFQLSNPC
jgi:hypothetical protein